MLRSLQVTDSPRRIRLVDFSPVEIRLFSAVLDLAEFGLSHCWQLSNEPEPDVCLIKQAMPSAFTDEPHSRYFHYAPSGSRRPEHTIWHDDSGVPLLHDLIAQLNQLADSADNDSTATADHISPTLLKRLLKAEQPLAIHLGPETLYIHPEQHCFYYSAPLEQLEPQLKSAANVSIQDINTNELSDLVHQAGLVAQPLKHLIWYIAFITSEGTLLDALSDQDVFRLNDWPYLGVSSRHYIKLATYLKNHRACFADAVKEADIATDIANNFYNASHLAGLIDADSPAPADSQATHSSPKESLSFLDKIKNRLRH